MDVRSQPAGITGGDRGECTWPCHERPPRGGREARAGDKGAARGARAQGGAQGSRVGRDSPSQRLGCAPRGAEGLRAAAAARRRAGVPWWRARGGGCRRRAMEDGRRALAGRGGRLALGGRRAGAEHRPGRGGLRRRPERGQASSSICWRCPLPSAARGRRLKGEDPVARVRGGGSARPRDCGCRRTGTPGLCAPAAAARPCGRPLARRLHRGPRAGAGAPRPAAGEPERLTRCWGAASGRF